MNTTRVIGCACLVAAVSCAPAWSTAQGAQDKQSTSGDATPADFKVVGGPALDARGFISWLISSPYQDGPNPVEVLCADDAKKGTRFPVIYFLQVGPDFGAWGNPMIEARSLDRRQAAVLVQRQHGAPVGGGIAARGNELHGFSIAGEDRKFVRSKGEIAGSDTVVAWNDTVARPVKEGVVGLR